MSIESAMKFEEKMNTDLEFRKNVMDIEDIKEYEVFIAKEGFDFTGKELKEVKQEISKDMNIELRDEELGSVVGGLASFCQPCTKYSTSAYCKQR